MDFDDNSYRYLDVVAAAALARQIHAGIVDRAGAPYMDHVARVFNSAWNDVILRRDCVDRYLVGTVAYLHDVVEDGGITVNDIRADFGDDVADAVDLLTRPDGMTYMDYIDRMSGNLVALIVKRADLMDNMNVGRLATVTDEDIRRNKRYAKAFDKVNKYIETLTITGE